MRRIISTVLIFVTIITLGAVSFETARKNNILQVYALQEKDDNKASAPIPTWEGHAYIAINNNCPSFTKKQKKKARESFVKYSKLDKKNRAGAAIASVSLDTVNEDERAPISSIKPSGWQTLKYPDIVDGNYVYNRCHLLMQKAAAGIKTDECNSYKNLVTGTRYMNVDGQLPFEMKILNYVYETGNHVLYRTTPIYKGKNFVCSGVQMEAYSVEDNGKGVCFNVYCFNVQPGLKINYKSGKVKESDTRYKDMILAIKNGATTVVVPDEAQDESESGLKENKDGAEYVLNTNTHKFHLPSCDSCKDIAAHNKKEGKYKRAELIATGYMPCGRCKP